MLSNTIRIETASETDRPASSFLHGPGRRSNDFVPIAKRNSDLARRSGHVAILSEIQHGPTAPRSTGSTGRLLEDARAWCGNVFGRGEPRSRRAARRIEGRLEAEVAMR